MDRDAQVVARFALAQFDGFGIECGVKFMCNACNGMNKAVHFRAHHFNGEAAWVDDERLFNHG